MRFFRNLWRPARTRGEQEPPAIPPAESLEQVRDRCSETIERLESKVGRHVLTNQETEALGRAHFDYGVALFVHEKKAEAREHISQARRYVKIDRAEMVEALAKGYASREDVSDQAVDFYLELLQIPAGQVSPAVVRACLLLLEEICQIDDDTPAEMVPERLRRNSLLTSLPGTEPRLIVLVEGEPARRYLLQGDTTRIGRAEDNDIVLSDDTVDRHHAVVTRVAGAFELKDVDGKSKTVIHSSPITAPVILKSGERFRCGATSVVFFGEAVALSEEPAWAHRNLAAGLLQQGRYSDAVAALEKAGTLDPADADVPYYLGRVRQAEGNHEEAVRAYAKALEVSDKHHQAHFWWARSLMERVRDRSAALSEENRRVLMDEALQHLEAAAGLDPDNDFYLSEQADVLLLAGRPRDAIKAIEAAIILDENNIDHHLWLLRVAIEQQDSALAKSAAEHLVAKDSRNRQARCLLGNDAYVRQAYAEAADHFERVYVQPSQDGRLGAGWDEEQTYRFGRSLFEVGRHVSASRVLAAVAKTSRDAMFYTARCHSQTGRFASAGRIFRALLERFGDEGQARYYLATSLGNAGDYDQALAEADRLAAQDEWKARGLCLAARLLMRMGRLDDARARLAQAEAAAPEHEEVHFEKGRLACIAGDCAAAQRAFECILQARPSDARSHLWLGRALLAQSQLEAARKHFQLAIEHASRDAGDAPQIKEVLADAHYYLGRLGWTREDYEDAIVNFAEARKKGNKTESLPLELAACYMKARRYADAFAELSSLPSDRLEEASVATNLAAVSCRVAMDHIKARRYDQAIPFLQEAARSFKNLGADEQLGETEDMLAEAFFRSGLHGLSGSNGRIVRSIAAFEQARQLRDQDHRYTYYHAVACFKNGDFEQAASLFEATSERCEDLRPSQALALALERAGKTEEAKQVWMRLIDRAGPDSVDKIDALLGLAGLYSRAGDREKATELLQQMLACPAVGKHPAYQDLCKLTISYLCLCGRHADAEALIATHTKQGFSDYPDLYIAAILAQESELEKAIERLERAIDTRKTTAEGLSLYEAVGRTLAARDVLRDDLEKALTRFQDVARRKKKVHSETHALVEALKLALLLERHGSDGNPEKRLAAYEKALKAYPRNHKILLNLAILNHRLAIEAEESGNFFNADGHWTKAKRLWQRIVTGREFWNAFLADFNQGGGKRDSLGEGDVPRAVEHVSRRVAQLHGGFAQLYAGGQGEPERCEWHLKAAKDWHDSKEFRDQLATELQRQVSLGPKGRDPQYQITMLELIGRELKPDDKTFGEQIENLRLAAVMDALARQDIPAFQRGLQRLSTSSSLQGDMRQMAACAARTEPDFIRQVVRSALAMLGMARMTPDNPVVKNMLLVIVLRMCVEWEKVPYFQRDLVKQNLPMIVGNMVAAVVKAMAAQAAGARR